MTIIYDNKTGTSRIEVVERWNGNDIILTVNIGNVMETSSRHNLSVAESDKLGAALCKDIIDNYTGRNSRLKDKIADLEGESRNVRYYNATLRDEKAELESRIHNLRDHVREHNQHAHQLCASIEYLEAINSGLENDVSTLRMTNALYRKRWDDHEDRQ